MRYDCDWWKVGKCQFITGRTDGDGWIDSLVYVSLDFLGVSQEP